MSLILFWPSTAEHRLQGPDFLKDFVFQGYGSLCLIIIHRFCLQLQVFVQFFLILIRRAFQNFIDI